MATYDREELMHISSAHREQFRERRSYEWRTFILEETLLILMMAFVVKESEKLQELGWFAFGFAIASAFLSILYLSWIHSASNIDKNRAELAEDLIGLSEEEQEAELGSSGDKKNTIYSYPEEDRRNPERWYKQYYPRYKHFKGTWSF